MTDEQQKLIRQLAFLMRELRIASATVGDITITLAPGSSTHATVDEAVDASIVPEPEEETAMQRRKRLRSERERHEQILFRSSDP